MIFTKKCTGKDFTIKMHWKWFYYKNALEMIFIIKMHWKWFLYKNVLAMIVNWIQLWSSNSWDLILFDFMAYQPL